MTAREGRIWITGVGLTTSLGSTREATWTRLMAGERSMGPVTLFDTEGQRSRIAAEAAHVPALPPGVEPSSRTAALAWASAREALGHAKLSPKRVSTGLCVGTTTGGMLETEEILASALAAADPRVGPDAGARARLTTHPLSAVGDALVDLLGPFARVRTLCSACSSGANALVLGATWLRHGSVDAVLVGGADALSRLTFTGFNALGAMAPDACRPFDRRRRGLTLGEGGAFLVLEREGSARKRGVRPVAELAGFAMGAEAHHITHPDPQGVVAARLLGQALARAGVAPPEVRYVNAHGTATVANDPMEARALEDALGPSLDQIPVSSSKGQLGHTLGAAGALEAGLTALAVERGRLPPGVGLEEPDPACALRHVGPRGCEAQVPVALSNAFGFGGMATVLVVRDAYGGDRVEDAGPARLGPRPVVVTGVATLGEVDAEGALASLDGARARRLDRGASLATALVARALEDAGRRGALSDASQAAGAGIGDEGVGLVLGSAFGDVDGAAAYVQRLLAKGPRLASPADFPNLVPSSPAGHASVYLGLRGPVLATGDLSASGEAALVTAVELLGAGLAKGLVAGALEPRSRLVEGVLGAVFAGAGALPRGEGGGAVVLETADEAAARGARIHARVVAAFAWRDGGEGPVQALSLPPPKDPSTARVLRVRADPQGRAMLADSPWAACPEHVGVQRSSSAAGHHEALGAVVFVEAVGILRRGEAREILVVGTAPGRGYALVLSAP